MNVVTYERTLAIIRKFHAIGQMPRASEVAQRYNGGSIDRVPICTDDVLPVLEQMVRDKLLVKEYEVRSRNSNPKNLQEMELYRLPESKLRPKPFTNVPQLLAAVEWLTLDSYVERYGYAPHAHHLVIMVGCPGNMQELFAAPGEYCDMVQRAFEYLAARGETDGRTT